jgi:RHS repeat-associated protein
MTSIDNIGTFGVPAVKLSYSYDAVGNLVTVGDSIANVSAGRITYAYDAINRATSIIQAGSGVQEKHVDMTYDALNQLTKLSRFKGVNSVAETTYSYDSSRHLTQIAHKRSTTVLAAYDYTYDVDDRITKIVSSIDGATDYSYDSTNQLTGADHSSQTDEAYSYDANGNRTNAGYQTGGNNQMLADGNYAYEYDNEGNRTKRTEIATGKSTDYIWDYRNRLAQVISKDANGAVTKNIEYTYDVNNLRVGKKIDGVVTERYIIDRNQISLVFNGSGTQTHRYLYGTEIDQVLADETTTSLVWSLADRQGTVRDLADGDGAVIDHITYDSFGQVLTQTSNIDLRFAYTGREWDRETEQYYYRARYYDAAVGRFISEDPISFKAGDANLSRYVTNNPTNHTDPSGLDVWIEEAGEEQMIGHRKIVVGTRGSESDRFAITFGPNVVPFVVTQGLVQRDSLTGGSRGRYLITTPKQDVEIIRYLSSLVGRKGLYVATGYNCRTFSDNTFDYIKKTWGLTNEYYNPDFVEIKPSGYGRGQNRPVP